MPTPDNLPNDVQQHITHFIKQHNWDSLAHCPADDKNRILVLLIENCLKMKFWYRLTRLYQFDKASFRAALQFLERSPLQNILTICVSQDFDENLLTSDFANFGQMEHYHALIICAALKSKNHVLFSPVVLEYYEVNNFLEIIKANQSALLNQKIIFLIIEEGHWFTGEIIVTDTHIRLFLIDSLGWRKAQSNYASIAIQQYLKENFVGKYYVQFAALTAQHSNSTCQIFALDYMRKLHRLPSIFTVLPAPQTSTTQETVTTPLSLMRSAQLSDLTQQIQKHPQYCANQPINKKGQTIDEAVIAHIIYEAVNDKVRATNRYLERKHLMLFQKAISYLAVTSPEQKKQEMEQFSVEGFRERIRGSVPMI